MTDATTQPATRLWTEQGFRDDDWSHAEGADALDSNGRFILPLPAYLDLEPEARRLASERIGVLLQPGDQLEAIEAFLDELALVALAFPAFSDGRSYSKAQLLRSRHDFAGKVRATGQILVDQLPLMIRVGFDEFEISNPVLLKRLGEGRVGGIDYQYQPAAKASQKPSIGAGYSWRRVAG